MKNQVNKELIIDGLQKVQSVINPRNALPVLSNVLIRAATDIWNSPPPT
jgi:DNA polymerase III sliding clamp (beta) subunit (PCNA family)